MSTAERWARELERCERSLLDAALALLDRDDWQAVTVEAIAERAEYAKGTVYRHFTSKDDLYAPARRRLDRGHLRHPRGARRRPAVRGGARRLRRRRLGARDRRRGARAAARARPAGGRARRPEARAGLDAAGERLHSLLAGLIDWGVAEAAIPDAPPESRLFVLEALLAGAAALPPFGALADPGRALADAALAVLRAGGPG